ncbi:DUF4038 domain-containing protein [Paenibacillus antri]|uniref:DUF4038 domain-containing protein n=1 Tax=Paenibacillus antri TaxID=2582848 RepID=A0A5R9GEV8_9BACL|nr:DUF4038 domain-containing protein [Paenibacillus antri]
MTTQLRIAETNDRFALDGRPFFYLADTVWNAFTNATEEEWEEYLRFRDVRPVRPRAGVRLGDSARRRRCVRDDAGPPDGGDQHAPQHGGEARLRLRRLRVRHDRVRRPQRRAAAAVDTGRRHGVRRARLQRRRVDRRAQEGVTV